MMSAQRQLRMEEAKQRATGGHSVKEEGTDG